MDPIVVDMHTKSGLLPAIRASTITIEEAGAATLDFIRAHVPDPRTVPLCGNSIGTDRRFLDKYLPEIENYLHYRSVDVSSVKELVKRWYPDLTQAMPRKAGLHRALDDIRSSIEELRYYRGVVFVPPVAVAATTDDAATTAIDAEPTSPLMRAVVLSEYGGPEVLRVGEVDDPVPGPDEILVAVEHSAVNRADVLQRLGRYADPRRPDQGLGGAQKSRRSPASNTPARWLPSAQRVTEWSPGDAVMGIESGGCYAELVVTHARQAMAVPAGLQRARRRSGSGGLPDRVGRLGRAGRPDERAVGARPCRGVRCRDGGDPDRQGDRRQRRRHVLVRQDRVLRRPRRRHRPRAVAGGLARSPA